MGQPNLPASQAARVLKMLEARLDANHEGNIEAFARALGIAQSALWRTMHRQHQPSRATAAALARLEGVSLESLLSGPRERAAELAREAGYSEAEIQRILATPEHEELRPVLWYVDRMRTHGRARNRAAELAREAGVAEAAIRSVVSDASLPEHRPVLWYVDRMRAAAVLADRGQDGG